MILVGQYDSPFVRRVAVTLHYYHMPFTRQPLSVFKNHTEVAAFNPLVRVPILILETGETLIESGAIIDHLDHVAGQVRSLTPGNGPERRKVLHTVALATGAMDKTLAIYMERRNHPAKALSHEWETRCVEQLTATLIELEKQCGTPWFSDLHMSQADVSIGCMIGFLKLRVPEIFPADKYAKLHRLSMHCEMREEFAACRPVAQELKS